MDVQIQERERQLQQRRGIDIADMLYTMKITSEEIKGKITILKEHIENNENKRIN
jgi:hypothetical protein